jgi:hypothetical protein
LRGHLYRTRANLVPQSAGGCRAPDRQMRRLCQTLPNHAVALRHCRKARVDLVVGISIQVEAQLNAVCSDGDVARDAKSAASVKLALRVEPCAADVDAERGRHACRGDSRAGQQGLQEHVAGAGAAGGWMQPRPDRAGPRLRGAGDGGVGKGCGRLQWCQSAGWLIAVSLSEGVNQLLLSRR